MPKQSLTSLYSSFITSHVLYGILNWGCASIIKEDCVNHVAKRMGTALRSFVEASKAAKNSVAGKGKLTQQKIAKIQNHYGKAIKDNSSDPELCKRRIMAILLHMSSTDENPKNAHCPPGPTSWCFFQRSIVKAGNSWATQ